jgi:hypothetical protein
MHGLKDPSRRGDDYSAASLKVTVTSFHKCELK